MCFCVYHYHSHHNIPPRFPKLSLNILLVIVIGPSISRIKRAPVVLSVYHITIIIIIYKMQKHRGSTSIIRTSE